MTSPKLAKSTRSGRVYVHPLTQVEVPSVTTILGQIGKADALKWWAAREVATYAVTKRDAWQALDEQAAIDLLKREPLRSLDRAANRGTDVHALAETLGKTGTMPEWADHLDGYVSALRRFWNEHQPVPVLVEKTVFGDGYAGSFDLVCKMPIFGDDLVIMDYKTSKAVYPDTAAQLAAYAYANEYHDDENSQMAAIPPIHRGAVVRLGADGDYELVEMNLLHGWELFEGARSVWQAQRNPLIVGKIINLPGDEQRQMMRAEIRARVQGLVEHRPAAVEQLRERWPYGVPTLAESDAHTAQQLSMILKVLTDVELEHDAPFTPVPQPEAPVQKATKKKAPAKKATPKPKKTVDDAEDHPGDGALDLLRGSVETGSDEQRAALKQTIAEAKQHGFKLSLQDKPTVHRYLAALYVWVHIQQDHSRATLEQELTRHGYSGTPGEMVAKLDYRTLRKLIDGKEPPKN